MVAKASSVPIIMNKQKLHSITEERLDVVKSLTQHVEANVSSHGPCW